MIKYDNIIHMFSVRKPYLIIPKLIEQPTWGGDYITKLKHWEGLEYLQDKKIGQSYELYGQSKLTLEITDSQDGRFIPEMGNPDTPEIATEFFPLKKDSDYIDMSQLVEENRSQVLGEKVAQRYGKMPLLIKTNQAYGNSFQLHVKPGTQSERWQPKPESWYYFEEGLVTFGINPDKALSEYKQVCHAINEKMKILSAEVKSGTKPLLVAQQEANDYIKAANPWQYVNLHRIPKYGLLDLSQGGLHHSWEENRAAFPQGNVLYEVQLDVMDPVSTIRSFDQGKFKSDGSIREIQIEDYFKYLDTDPAHNDIKNALQTQNGTRLLTTPYYCMDLITCAAEMKDKTGESFCHLFVREGGVVIKTADAELKLRRGHSCFIPQAVGEYSLSPQEESSVLLKTFIEL